MNLAAVQMRSVVLASSIIVLSGCATVSMVSGETTVETALSADQTTLRHASDAYCERLESEGWVAASNGFANLASILMHGAKGEDNGAEAYVQQFEKAGVPAAENVAQIAADIRSAHEGLEYVSSEARKVLQDESVETQRGDVTSFERALVRAQRASRTFASALAAVSTRAEDTSAADAAMDDFQTGIDNARRLADDLAARYAALGETSV